MAPLSVIVIARDEGAELRRTVENLHATVPPGSELLVVDDGSRDRCAANLPGGIRVFRTRGIGVAAARNYGAARARGEALVFADGHIRTPPGWTQPLLKLLRDPRVGASAPAIAGMRRDQPPAYGLTFRGPQLDTKWIARCPASPAPALILPGCCLAIRRELFDAAGGWDAGLQGIGGNDNEFCLRLWLLGYRLLIEPGVLVRHRFRRRSRVAIDPARHLHNHLRLAMIHFKPERVAKVFAACRREPAFAPALRLLFAGDAIERRRTLLQSRNKNDDWCFKQFGLKW